MKIRLISICLIVACTGWLVSGCAPRTYLAVDYRVPAADRVLAGRTVRLTVQDARQHAAVLSERAAAELKGFRDRFLMTVSTDGTAAKPAATYSLTHLFAAAFQRRLAALGVAVSSEAGVDVPLFAVSIQAVHIDLADRRWTARIGYTVRLSRDAQNFAEETVTGTAERLHLMDRTAADTLLGELFTDVVNRLDAVKLFRQAGLH